MAGKPLVKTNINLSTLGFKSVKGKGENAHKTYIFAELTDEISVKDNVLTLKTVGWELPNKKGTAPLKIDYEEGKTYTGSEQYPPTVGWCNVEVEGSASSVSGNTPPPPAPIEADDLPF